MPNFRSRSSREGIFGAAIVALGLSVSVAACGSDEGMDDSEAEAASELNGCSGLAIAGVTASGNDGNLPQNVLDRNLGTRWSSYGIGQYITAELTAPKRLCTVSIAWYEGNLRKSSFAISVSSDGSTFKEIYSGQSSGRTTKRETYDVPDAAARYVRVTVNGNSLNQWASISDLKIAGTSLASAGDGGTGSDSGSGGTDAGSGTPEAGSGTPEAGSGTPEAGSGTPEAGADASVPSTKTGCFAAPGACGYPDPAYHNVGVPPGTSLTPSGSVVVTTPGAVISNLDVAGSISVDANNVTIRRSRITVSAPGCGTATTCGNYGIVVAAGVTGTRIEDTEITTAPNATVEHAVRNLGGSTTTAVRLYTHHTDAAWYGSGTIRDSYCLAVLAINGDHLENLYYGGGMGPLVVDHSTMLNPEPQTSTVFVKTDFGDVTTLTVTNNLLAGGGWTLYGGGGGNGGTVTGPVTVTGNHFARCLTAEVFESGSGGRRCSGGADSHGYWPNSGYFGVAAYFPSNTTWSGNVWDDNLAVIDR